MRALISMLLALMVSASALAAPSEAEIESRAREVGQSLRCVICQNQSIEESEASLAVDMRRLVRARIRSGESNAEVITFMQERYGDYVLLKPPVQRNTYILWFAPFAFLAGIFIWLGRYRRRPETSPAPASLNPDEEEALKRLRERDAP